HKAMEFGFDRAKVMPDLALSLVMQGQYQRALDETADEPDSAALLTMRGYAELALHRLPEAVSLFERALVLEPGYPRAILGKARLAIAEADLDEAHRLVAQVLAATPGHAEALLLRADLNQFQGNDDEALAAYGEVLRIQTDNLSARIRRASLLATTGKFDAAQEDIDAARRFAPWSPLVTYAQAVALFRSDKKRPALESLQQVLKMAPDHMPSVMLASMLYYELDSPQQAERH